MKLLEIGGARIPALGLGTWQLETTPCEEMVAAALELGYRHVDTARAYGNEHAVGRAIERSGLPRDDVFVTTKLFLDDLARERVSGAVRESRDRLRSDWIDLVLVHWPSPTVPLTETLDALLEEKREGTVRHLGVSNFPPDLLEAAWRRTILLCDQVEYHPYLAQDGVLSLCRERGLMLTAYCPLARGRVAEDPHLRSIGERHGKSPAQVALRWLLQQEGVAAIPKAASRAHLEENLDVFDFELGADEMRTIRGLARGERLIDPEFAPDWSARPDRDRRGEPS